MERDAIDLICEQHADVLPDLDTTGLAVTGRLLRLSTLVQERRERLLAEHDLTQADFDVLATLRRRSGDAGMNPTDLLRSVMISSGGMTKRLDRLEAAGLIQRAPDPNDRRGLLVTLTAAGRRVITRALPAVLEAEAALVRDTIGTERDRDRLTGLLRALLRAFEDARPD